MTENPTRELLTPWFQSVANAASADWQFTENGVCFEMPRGFEIYLSDWQDVGYNTWRAIGRSGPCQPPFGPAMYPDQQRAARYLESVERVAKA